MSNPIVSSLFSAKGLEQSVLGRYRLPEQVGCRFLTGGVNDTYLVTTDDERYFLRLYRFGWRSKPEIEAEVDMLVHLASGRQAVSRPIPRSDGRFLTRVSAPEGTRWAVVFSDAPGTPPRLNASKAREYGEVVGDMHVCADRKPLDTRRFHLDFAHLLEDPLAHMEPFLRHRAEDRQFLTGVSEDLKSGIESLLPTEAPEDGFCHGDHHIMVATCIEMPRGDWLFLISIAMGMDGEHTIFPFYCGN